MKVSVEKTYHLELKESEIQDFLTCMNDVHEGNTPDFTFLYNLEETLCSISNV